jgi:hypothetical protein
MERCVQLSRSRGQEGRRLTADLTERPPFAPAVWAGEDLSTVVHEEERPRRRPRKEADGVIPDQIPVPTPVA